MTINEALHHGSRRLAAANVPDGAWDAELLLRHVLGWDRGQLFARLADPLPAAAEQRYDELTAARAERRPLQHLTGWQQFWHREFSVSPDVLIPRPETEILVEAALAHLEKLPSPVVLDVGTGSGCIALSIACDRPDARVHAIDVSPAALAVARRNAERLGCVERVRFYEGDLLAPVQALAGTVDLIASNPPYVERGEAASLPAEVRDHEPEIALFAEGHPLSVYRRLVPAAWSLLRAGGWLVLEVGLGMSQVVESLAREAAFVSAATLPDLAGIGRVVLAHKAETPGGGRHPEEPCA